MSNPPHYNHPPPPGGSSYTPGRPEVGSSSSSQRRGNSYTMTPTQPQPHQQQYANFPPSHHPYQAPPQTPSAAARKFEVAISTPSQQQHLYSNHNHHLAQQYPQYNHSPYNSAQSQYYPAPAVDTQYNQFAQPYPPQQAYSTPSRAGSSHQQQRGHIHHNAQTPSARKSHPPQSPAPPQQTATLYTHDHTMMLIALAESFFETAHDMGAQTSIRKDDEARLYYKLMATGMACLESVLLPGKGKAVPPKIEAMVRLRYAGVMYEETENMQEAEQVLVKGILMASRVGDARLSYGRELIGVEQ